MSQDLRQIVIPDGSNDTVGERVEHIKAMTHLSKNIRSKMINTILQWAHDPKLPYIGPRREHGHLVDGNRYP